MNNEQLEKIKDELLKDIEDAVNIKKLGEAKVKAFGKAGLISSLSKGMKDLLPEERPKFGAMINELRTFIENKLNNKQSELEKIELKQKLEQERIDITQPSNQSTFIKHWTCSFR